MWYHDPFAAVDWADAKIFTLRRGNALAPGEFVIEGKGNAQDRVLLTHEAVYIVHYQASECTDDKPVDKTDSRALRTVST